MTLKLIDSGDGQRTYDSSKWNGGTGSVTWVSAPSGQSGTWFQLPSGGGSTGRRIDLISYTGDTLVAGYRVELPASIASTLPLARFGELTTGTHTGHVTIAVKSDGMIEVRRGLNYDTGTIIGTSTTPIPFGTGVRYLEFKVKVHDSTGTVEVKCDEVSLYTLTGADTQNGGTSKCNCFTVLGLGQGAAFVQTQWKFRDVYVCGTDGSVNNNFLGVFKTGVKTVSGAGNSAQFTPSAGSNFQNVDDGTTVDNDTTYNSSSTVGHIDTFAMTSSGLASNAVIRGTQTQVVMRKDDVDPRSGATVLRSGSTNFAQTAVSLGTSYILDRVIQEVDPNTTNAWTQSNLDAVEVGYKVDS